MSPDIRTVNSGDQGPTWQEYWRRQEIRREHLVPLYVMWTSDVSEDAAIASVRGVEDAVRASRQKREVRVFGSRPFSSGEYSSSDWYADEAFRKQTLRRDVGYGLQLDTAAFSQLFTQEPWQENPHWEVLITNRDLNTKIRGNFINFIFGETNPDFAYSIQSVRRIENATRDRALNLEMIRNLLRHETGHMFGLVRRSEAVESLGNHCPNVCSMKQTLSAAELAENTIEVERRGIHFCADCQQELAQNSQVYKPL